LAFVDSEVQVAHFQENSSWLAQFDNLTRELEILAVFQKWNVMESLKTVF
jgi:hypothetical protein